MTSGGPAPVARRRAWLAVAGWTLFIYATIPLARTVQEFVRDHGGKSLFLWVTFAALGAALAAIVRAARRKTIALTASGAIVLAAIALVFCAMTWSLRANPEEAFHFVQYGVLSALIFRAYRVTIGDAGIYFASLALGATLGIADELIQWLVPKRFFDYRDIGINVMAVGLVQLAIAAGLRPSLSRSVFGSASLRPAFACSAIAFTLLLFCFSNTFALRQWYVEKAPVLASIGEITAEYGYRHQVPGEALFKSRLDAAELRRRDREDGARMAEILDDYMSERHYREFMGKFMPYEEPMLYEARVHLFRRDRYEHLSRHAESDGAKLDCGRIAWGEQRILESHFSNTLSRSRYAWSEKTRARYEEMGRASAMYASEVSESLITVASQKTLTLALVALIVVSVAGAWRSSRGVIS